jgi:hypothetical protein
MWASDQQELDDYYKWSLDPCDCESLLLEQGTRRVFITWKALDQSTIKNINIPASRILLENAMLDAPMVQMMPENLTQYTHLFPSDHVVFHQTIDGRFTSYSRYQLTRDWRFFFPNEEMPAYRYLATYRYSHFSQALEEYEKTGTMNEFMKIIITQYMKKSVGPCGNWNLAQLAVLGAAVCLMYPRDWDVSHLFPKFFPLKY